MEHTHTGEAEQASVQMARDLDLCLVGFLGPLLAELDTLLDRRLVATFLGLVRVIIAFRHSKHGLLLSELGAYLLSPTHAPAGTKRLSNLLRSRRWQHQVIDRYLWRRAEQRLTELERENEPAWLVWDESVLEKPESLALEGLCAVRSSQAARLKRIKPGFYNPPGGRPVFVPGMHWLGLLLVGGSAPPVLAAMHWWTSRGIRAMQRRSVEVPLLWQCALSWGRRVVHIWDRGFAGGPWLKEALLHRVRFVLRWPKAYQLLDLQGNRRKAWELTRGKRSWGQHHLWDVHRHCWRKVGVVALEIKHPELVDQPLWLVVSRPGQGREPWYLVTNEPIMTDEQAWQIVLAYAKRWQIEVTWRYAKSELAMQSPRLWAWENRLKLLLIVSLVYAFLLTLLDPRLDQTRHYLLRHWCHRTGKRSQTTLAPLYRLRSALSRLWLTYPPSRCLSLWQSSG